MANNEFEFEPRLGRIRSRGGKASKRFFTQAKAAAMKASSGFGYGPRKSGFTGARIGRGGGAAAVMNSAGGFGGSRNRRVMVKFSISKIGAAGAGVKSAAGAHLRYVQRDGVDRDGKTGGLYDREHDVADGRDFLKRSDGDRHQFRLIVSPEDGFELADDARGLKDFTRDFMTTVERDLGTKLDWVAVDHFNTGFPHTHIVLRGRADNGKDLVIAPDYIKQGFRNRAGELATRALGLRQDLEIAASKRAEVDPNASLKSIAICSNSEKTESLNFAARATSINGSIADCNYSG